VHLHLVNANPEISSSISKLKTWEKVIKISH
jgi:hypothetical protein